MTPKDKKLLAVGGCGFALLVVLCVVGYIGSVLYAKADEEAQWAKVTPTVEGHQAYLDWAIGHWDSSTYVEHTPMKEHEKQLKEELDHLKCAVALKEKDLKGLQFYVRFKKDGRHAEEARAVLVEHLNGHRDSYLAEAKKLQVSPEATAAIAGVLQGFADEGGALGSLNWKFEPLEGTDPFIPKYEYGAHLNIELENWQREISGPVTQRLYARFPNAFYDSYGESRAPTFHVKAKTYPTGLSSHIKWKGQDYGDVAFYGVQFTVTLEVPGKVKHSFTVRLQGSGTYSAQQYVRSDWEGPNLVDFHMAQLSAAYRALAKQIFLVYGLKEYKDELPPVDYERKLRRVSSVWKADDRVQQLPSALTLTLRGQAYEEQGDTRRALADYNAALKREPKSISALIARGKLLAKTNPAAAERDLEMATMISAKDIEAWVELGWVRLNRGNYAGAIEPFRKVEALRKKDTNFFALLGFALALNGDDSGARDALKEQESLCWPDATLWLAGLGGVPARLDELAKADRWESDVAKLYLGEISADALLEKARAAPVADRPVRLLYAHLHVGLKAEAAGNAAGAKEHYRQAVAQERKTYTEHMLAKVRLAR